MHSGMIGLGGWLPSVNDITLGQFVAAEVIVGTLLLNLDTVARRMYAAIYVATSLQELSTLFDMPKEEVSGPIASWLPDPCEHGFAYPCKDVFSSPRRTDSCSSTISAWKSCQGKDQRAFGTSRTRRHSHCFLPPVPSHRGHPLQ